MVLSQVTGNHKIMKPIYDSKVRPVLTKEKDVATYTGLRGYTTNLYPRLGQKAIRKQSFSIRVVEGWAEVGRRNRIENQS